ncbi:methyltransferase domain-containing protein [Paenibacillus sp. TRM 82003]|nr:methyltransferase domain-containing protein [Paenibacillus sp. TRM 82003]
MTNLDIYELCKSDDATDLYEYAGDPMNRVREIRLKEKEYHDHCYKNYKLYEQGTWLHKPVKTVLDLFSLFDDREEVHALDLGSGIGRNSIPLAERMKNRKGEIVCVDLLETAIDKLQVYSSEYGVRDKIACRLSDIGEYNIELERYDYICAVSSLEHLDTEITFDKVVAGMISGTKVGGINCIIASTNVTETIMESGEEICPMYELNFKTDYLINKLRNAYSDWSLLKQTLKPYEVEIERDGIRVLLRGDVVTWAVQKSN